MIDFLKNIHVTRVVEFSGELSPILQVHEFEIGHGLELRKVVMNNLSGLGRLGLRGRGRSWRRSGGRSRGRRSLSLLDAERFFMNVAHLFRSAGVEGQDRLAEGRSKGFRVVLGRGEQGKEGKRERGDTSYATFEYPLCSSTLFTRVWASLRVDWTLPETVWSGPRARWPADLSRSDMNDKNFLEIPCLSANKIKDRP